MPSFVDHLLPRHGNYCGRHWTAGRWQPGATIERDELPTDPVDAACAEHDADWARGDFVGGDRRLVERLHNVPETHLSSGARFMRNAAIGWFSLKNALADKQEDSYAAIQQATAGRRNHAAHGNPKSAKQKQKRAARRKAARAAKRGAAMAPVGVTPAPKVSVGPKRGGIRGAPLLPNRTVGVNVRATNREVVPEDIWNYERVYDRRTGMSGIQITGTDFLMNVPSGTKAFGDVLVDQLIGARAIGGSRLKQFARLFTRYRFVDFGVEFQGVSGTAQGGICVGFIDYDPTETIINLDPETRVRKAEAHLGKTDVKLFDGVTTHEFGMPNGELLYSPEEGLEPRLTYQGRYFLVVKSGFTVTGNDTASISVRYKVQFFVPELEEDAAQITSGYYGIRQSPDVGAQVPGYLAVDSVGFAIEAGSDTNFTQLGVTHSGSAETDGGGDALPKFLFKPLHSTQQKYYLTTQMQNTVNSGNINWTASAILGGTFTTVLQGQLSSASGAITCGLITMTAPGTSGTVGGLNVQSTSYTTKTDSWWWAFAVPDTASMERLAQLNYMHLDRAGLLKDVQRVIRDAMVGLDLAPQAQAQTKAKMKDQARTTIIGEQPKEKEIERRLEDPAPAADAYEQKLRAYILERSKGN